MPDDDRLEDKELGISIRYLKEYEISVDPHPFRVDLWLSPEDAEAYQKALDDLSMDIDAEES